MKLYLSVVGLLLLGTACSKTTVQPAPLSAQLRQNGELFDFFLRKSKPPQSTYTHNKITYTRDGARSANIVFTHGNAGQESNAQLGLTDATGENSMLEFHPAASAGTQLQLTDASGTLLYAQYVEAGTELFDPVGLPVTDSPQYTLTVVDGATGTSAHLVGALGE